MSESVRILIVDDHAAARQGLRALLETEEGFDVVGLAATGPEARRSFEELHPDVTLLDVRLAEESGLDVLSDIRGRHPEAAILMISAYDRWEDVRSARSLGAKGYLLKDLEAGELLAAIRAARAGEEAAGPRVAKGTGQRVLDGLGKCPEGDGR